MQSWSEKRSWENWENKNRKHTQREKADRESETETDQKPTEECKR